MRIFKTKPFSKDAKSEGLTDTAINEAIKEVQKGLVDAYLGGDLIKKRIGIGNKGKRGGVRTILVYKASATNIFCVHVFAKNDKDEITPKEREALKQLGKTLMN